MVEMRSLSPLCVLTEPVLDLPLSSMSADRWALIYGDEFAEWMTMDVARRWNESRRLWDIYFALNPTPHGNPAAASYDDDSGHPETAPGQLTPDGRSGVRGLRRLGV